MAPSYSYIAEREDLHLIPLAILRTPPQRAWIESIIDDYLTTAIDSTAAELSAVESMRESVAIP